MKQHVILLAVLAALFPLSASAATKSSIDPVMAITEVAVSVPITVSISNPRNSQGYFTFTTANETATASLIVTIFNASVLGDILVCTTTAVTTNSQWTTYLGATVTPSSGVDQNCIFPMARDVKFVFTVTGAGADFDVTADMLWVTE